MRIEASASFLFRGDILVFYEGIGLRLNERRKIMSSYFEPAYAAELELLTDKKRKLEVKRGILYDMRDSNEVTPEEWGALWQLFVVEVTNYNQVVKCLKFPEEMYLKVSA